MKTSDALARLSSTSTLLEGRHLSIPFAKPTSTSTLCEANTYQYPMVRDDAQYNTRCRLPAEYEMPPSRIVRGAVLHSTRRRLPALYEVTPSCTTAFVEILDLIFGGVILTGQRFQRFRNARNDVSSELVGPPILLCGSATAVFLLLPIFPIGGLNISKTRGI